MSNRFHRNGSNVKGHYRNGVWISPHHRNEAWVNKDYTRSNHVSQNGYEGLDIRFKYEPLHHTFKSSVISKRQEIIKLEYVDRVYTTFFLDESYKPIIQEILQVIKTFAPIIKEKYLENKNEEVFKVFLNSYIEEYIEDKLLEINLIKKYFSNYDDVVLIAMILYLIAFEPSLYGMEFLKNTVHNEEKNYLSREEITEEIKKIITDNQEYLKLHFKKQNWDYIRAKFFSEKIEKTLKNPKIAIHMLFKKICEEELA
ncbi:MAG: hypothetical protein WBK95_05970 [Sulfurimonas sp.]|nr:hypothetical protein [Sulfurimonas sp.]MDD3059725.1 hypothetical protein [Sulfurimonas sp.]MDD5201807.1 hypothetical protein [Sulfurimonas sp.]